MRRLAPISAISLSVWMNLGFREYSLRKTAAHTSSAQVHFLSSKDDAVVKRQYDRGKPALSCSPRMVYSSRCLEFVLSVLYVSVSISDGSMFSYRLRQFRLRQSFPAAGK